MFGLKALKTVAAAGALALMASGAQAVTITPSDAGSGAGVLDLSTLATDDGNDASGTFHFAPFNTTSGSGSGNCELVGGTCLQFNPTQTTLMTLVGGGTFNLSALSFVLDGNPSILGVFNWTFGTPGQVIVSIAVGNDAYGTEVEKNTWYDLDFEGAADGVTSILFDNRGGGNVRIGGIVAAPTTTPTVPVPAAGFLLIGALGGLAALRLRRKA